MAKNLNSVSFTVLLLVLAMVSTGILKSEAAPLKCPPTGTGCITPKFYNECEPAPFTGTNADCCTCCLTKYGSPPVCGAIIEGSDTHCHCYSN